MTTNSSLDTFLTKLSGGFQHGHSGGECGFLRFLLSVAVGLEVIKLSRLNWFDGDVPHGPELSTVIKLKVKYEGGEVGH